MFLFSLQLHSKRRILGSCFSLQSMQHLLRASEPPRSMGVVLDASAKAALGSVFRQVKQFRVFAKSRVKPEVFISIVHRRISKRSTSEMVALNHGCTRRRVRNVCGQSNFTLASTFPYSSSGNSMKGNGGSG